MGGRRARYLSWVALGVVLVLLGGFALTPYFKGNATVNPVLVNFGVFPVYWYGLIMTLATLGAFIWWQRRATPKLGEIHPINLATWLILFGLIGARLVFVALKWTEFAPLPWWSALDLHGGGLSIHGALLGGAMATIIYARRYHLPLLGLFDLLVPPVLLGQIIGRLGNFFNQEAFGGPTNLPWKMWVAPEFRLTQFADQSFFHPTFLYSMIGLAGVLIIVLLVERRSAAPGVVLLTYLIVYSVERFIIEFFRADSDHLSVLSLAQWASIVVIMIALAISLIWRGRTKI
ncbi:prolipoprotein diacylglyceryl transferase [Patescibacteria group bacterium]|nr:prolipoprotein diacylglyceryl transferase [Patescibacteria group bacterium]